MKTMHKISSLFIAAVFVTAISCTNNKTANDEGTSDSRYNAVVAEKNSAESNLYQTMNEIDNNLKIIRANQGLIASSNLSVGSEKLSKKEEILRNIAEINTLLAENKVKIEKLNDQLASLKSQKMRWKKQSAEITKFIEEKGLEMASLKQQIEEQQNTIVALNKKVNDLELTNKSINDMANENAERMSIELQGINAELHKAYYALGSYKELKKHNVVEKKGGVLGIGSTEELKPNFEKSYFTQIDTRETTSIPVNSKNAKLVTYHPVGSYEWEKAKGDMEYLTIKDPDKFWAASKYLVVEVK